MECTGKKTGSQYGSTLQLFWNFCHYRSNHVQRACNNIFPLQWDVCIASSFQSKTAPSFKMVPLLFSVCILQAIIMKTIVSKNMKSVLEFLNAFQHNSSLYGLHKNRSVHLCKEWFELSCLKVPISEF